MPWFGAKLFSTGGVFSGIGSIKTKSVVLLTVPSGLVMRIGPVPASAGTVAVMTLLSTMVNVAGFPLKETAVTPAKWFPVRVTTTPGPP